MSLAFVGNKLQHPHPYKTVLDPPQAGAALPIGQRGGAMYPPTFGSHLGGTKGYIDAGGTRKYMKISMCYEVSLRVDSDLR